MGEIRMQPPNISGEAFVWFTALSVTESVTVVLHAPKTKTARKTAASNFIGKPRVDGLTPSMDVCVILGS